MLAAARVKVEVGVEASFSLGDDASRDVALHCSDEESPTARKRKVQDNEERKKNEKRKRRSIVSSLQKKSFSDDDYSKHSEEQIFTAEDRQLNSSTSEMETENTKANDTALPLSNLGWADAMAKVLQTHTKKNVILEKAKKDRDVKMTDSKIVTNKVEIVDEKGDTVKEKTDKTDNKECENVNMQKKLLFEKKQKKLLWHTMARTKPHINDKEKERALNRAATRGVIQLFNAVRQHQKALGEKLKSAGNSEVKKEKVMKSFTKGAFLDMLKGVKNEKEDTEVNKNCESADKTWNVLRDDFMMGAKLKDWDKDSEDDY